jgi:hypothetical protein
MSDAVLQDKPEDAKAKTFQGSNSKMDAADADGWFRQRLFQKERSRHPERGPRVSYTGQPASTNPVILNTVRINKFVSKFA